MKRRTQTEADLMVLQENIIKSRVMRKPRRIGYSERAAQDCKTDVKSNPKQQRKEKGVKKGKKQSPNLTWMKHSLKMLGIEVVDEYKFSPDRKFRADIYLPHFKTLIEYDGMFSAKSRHLSVTGFSKDTEKLNLATILGFRVLRYTAMTYKQMLNDITKL